MVRDQSRNFVSEVSVESLMGANTYLAPDVGAVLFRYSPNAVFTISKNGECASQNLAAQALLGVFGEKNANVTEFLPEIDLGRVCEAISRAEEYKVMINRAGRSYRLIILGMPELGIAGAYGIEISDLTRTEADLLRSQNVLRKVLDTDPNLIFVKDKFGRFLLANQAVADVYGTSVDRLIGRKDSDFNPKSEEIDHFTNDDLEVIQSQTEKRILEESVSDFAGNSRFFSTVKRPLILAQNEEPYVLGVSTDISAIKKLQEQLAQASKMEALGQLAGGIAHDFNNLLTAILGYSEILKVSHTEDEIVVKSASMIKVAADRAKMLTEQLLGFARRGKQQNIIVDLHCLINDTLAILKRTFDPSIQIEIELLSLKPYVLGDPVQLQQVIMNLLINSRDAVLTAINGELPRIVISTKDLEDVNFKTMTRMELVCTDNGCGMNSDIQKKIFEPFFTTKEVGRGTGLGLSMAYGIVKNHGGDIRVESREGIGTQFYISFPQQAGIELTREESVKEHSSRVRVGRALLVDDHPDVLAVATSMLKTLDIEVVAFTSGVEAVESFSKKLIEVDLAVIDMLMPHLNGVETAKALRKILPSLPVIIVSGYAQSESIQEIIKNGYSFLKKPFELASLAESIRAVIGEEIMKEKI